MLAQLGHEHVHRDCVHETITWPLLVLQAIEDQAYVVKVILDEIDGGEFVDHRGFHACRHCGRARCAVWR
jgi:hypothetical protein